MNPIRYYNWLSRAALILFVVGLSGALMMQEVQAQANNPTGFDRAAGMQDDSGMADVWESSAVRGGPIEGSWEEHFEDVATLGDDGWEIQNNSDPEGTSTWFQGNPAAFTAHTGGDDEYIAVNFQSTTGVGTISNWLMTPEIVLQNGTELSFFTRTSAGSQWPDRLQVRMSTEGASTDVGFGAEDEGNFVDLLLDINEDLIQGGYPETWSQFTLEVSGLSEPTTGRFAFRYYVHGGGPSGDNSNYIGVDAVAVAQPGVSTDDGATATSFSMTQNHPNPFANSTTIQYTLGEAAPVRIDVFDVTGRLVTTVVNAEMPAGTHTAIWNANGVASGMYLYRIQAGSQTQTMRAIVAR